MVQEDGTSGNLGEEPRDLDQNRQTHNDLDDHEQDRTSLVGKSRTLFLVKSHLSTSLPDGPGLPGVCFKDSCMPTLDVALTSVVSTAASVFLAVVVFGVSVWKDHSSGEHRNLAVYLGRAAAAGSIPTGVVLIVGAVHPAILASFPGMNLQIALGGLSMLYVSYDVLFPPPPKK